MITLWKKKEIHVDRNKMFGDLKKIDSCSPKYSDIKKLISKYLEL